MWYLAWILGIILVCTFSVITALILEHLETKKTKVAKKSNISY